MANEPEPTVVPGIDLETFERTIYHRDGSPESFEKCAADLYALLKQVRRGGGFFGVHESKTPVLYTRLAGAVTHLLIDPKFVISDSGFVHLCAEHTTLQVIFRASSYETADHILSCTGTRMPNGQMTFTNRGVLILLLCWSFESNLPLDLDYMFAANPQATQAAIVGMLSMGVTISEQAYARRLYLMSKRNLIGSLNLPEPLILSAGDLYMHCSYVDAPDKHEVKPIINRWFRQLAMMHGVTESTAPLERKDRPTIVIPVEWFGSHHAMFRCYSRSIQQLRERFRTVCIYRGAEVDAEGLQAFDKAVSIEGESIAITKIIEAIQNEKPDIIFYPSIGMAAWFVALSTLRLAPIQIMCPGHPASSFSSEIDYFVTEKDLIGNPDLYGEKTIGLPVGTLRYVPRSGFTPLRPVDVSTSRRVAVPAMATKLIPPFLRALQQIKERHPDIEYVFFPNQVSIAHDIITKDLRRWFPNCIVHPRTDYQTYMDRLGECLIALDTFPFGGTNSALDCLLLGMPIIVLENDDHTGRAAAQSIRRLGMREEWFIAYTANHYVQLADDEIHLAKHGTISMPSAAAVEAEFFGDGPPEVQGEFVRAFWQIYEEGLK